ncbi:MAG: hypothetical protein WD751_03235 [Anaerolineales bacterium]
MDRKRSFPWLLASVSVLAIVALIAALLPAAGMLPAPPTGTPTASRTPTQTYTPSTTGTQDPCAPGSIEPLAIELNEFSREFDDRLAIAQNTARELLSPEIASLQDIRRRAENAAPPACLEDLQALQLAYMNGFIEVLLFLYGPTGEQMTCNQTENGIQCTGPAVEGVNQGMLFAIEYRNQYLLELGRLLGIELITATPTTNPSPEGSPPAITPTP